MPSGYSDYSGVFARLRELGVPGRGDVSGVGECEQQARTCSGSGKGR
jgi:hypothetical protein